MNEVKQTRAFPVEWTVAEPNSECASASTTFNGHNAEARANDYADFLNTPAANPIVEEEIAPAASLVVAQFTHAPASEPNE